MMTKRTDAEEAALTEIARREIAWTMVRKRVRVWVIGGAAVIGAGLFLWREGRDVLTWIFR